MNYLQYLCSNNSELTMSFFTKKDILIIHINQIHFEPYSRHRQQQREVLSF